MTQRGRAVRSAGHHANARPRSDGATTRRARLHAVVEPVVNATGYDLEEISLSRAGRRHLVRVIVDGDDGVNLDRIADISRAVSSALDAAEESGSELIAGEYQLEVSSPGVDRPLILPRHWRRNVGRLVKVTTKAGAGLPQQRAEQSPTGRQITGRVLAADDVRVVLDCDGQRTEWSYADLGPGRVQVEFSRLDELTDEDLTDIEDDDDDDVEDEER